MVINLHQNALKYVVEINIETTPLHSAATIARLVTMRTTQLGTVLINVQLGISLKQPTILVLSIAPLIFMLIISPNTAYLCAIVVLYFIVIILLGLARIDVLKFLIFMQI